MDRLDEIFGVSASFSISEPDVARAIELLSRMGTDAQKGVVALSFIMGTLIGRVAPSSKQPLHRAALDGIEAARTFTTSAAIDVFEAALLAASTPPTTDGDGLPIDTSKIVELFKKAA